MFTIDDIKVELAIENIGIRLTTHNDDSIILQNQTMASVENIVKENFQIVKSYYQAKSVVSVSIDKRDLSVISLKIVLDYLYMYKIWYFKNKYPEGYSTKCELMLSMSVDEFKSYEKRWQEFHDMWR